MAVKRAGLGRGLDGMFTSYLDRSKGEKKEAGSGAETTKDQAPAVQEDEKLEKSKKTASSKKETSKKSRNYQS